MLLLRNPRGTCGCGCKNDWLCIRQHVGILGGVGSPLPRFFPSLLLSVLPSCCLLRYWFLLEDETRIRRQTRRKEEDQDQDQEEEEEEEEGKHLNHI